MNPSQYRSTTLFKLSRKESEENNRKDEENIQQEQEMDPEDAINILCVIHKNGKVGSAFYNFQEKLLYVHEEMVDIGPQFLGTSSLFREVKPKYVLSFGNTADNFIKVLIDTITTGGEFTVTSDSIRSLPENFFLLPSKEYTYEICKAVISQLNLASNADEPSEVKREVYIHSLINFEHRLSIQAVGTLIKYLDKNWAFFNIDKEDLQYLHINQVTRKDHILVDAASFNALHIFAQRGHDASFKRGLQSSSREGLSVFRLFSANCQSKIGQVTLKSILLSPIKNVDELNKRLDFINFVLQPGNKDFVESLQENIKQLSSDINMILTRIQNSRANNREWQVLYKAIYHTIFINNLSRPYREKSELLVELHNAVSPDLLGLEQSIENGLDFNAGEKRGRPIVRFGLDENLDAKKLRQQDIAKDVTAAARFAANELPDFINECAVVYLPEMGHLIAIKEWEPNCNPEQLHDLGFQFMFTLRDTIHYKNPLCVELDKRLGDINAEIIDHENRILRRLSGFILKYNKDIREPLKIIGLMDCLISMAIVAAQNAYIRPKLNNESTFEIENCRHLLMEHMIVQFQQNSFYSGGKHSRMKIITGPNGSGKTMYLKQIALIVFLAHVGSYLPAKNANIGLVHSIHSRMQATESAAVRLSAFMIDVSQITQALNTARSSSLILMDEFGRGTAEEEGISLLVGAMKKFLERKEACPHVVVSTHFQQIVSHMPETSLVQYLKMDHAKEEKNLCFLYKVTEGISSSFAFDISESIGFDKDVLVRAREIVECLKKNEPIHPLDQNLKKTCKVENLAELDIPQPDEN
ncbi:mutS protein homolog 5-like isoform X2 [Anoplophora glabripennis]|uniref:mutS protein homolog 5-like isoform X2 n=1 Tax=Anoplophora glabripennis TaxID=217634 RepID=UPI0008753097|nr:mutS protein homolog 5-like isoform X2 [Anoplophora glabripennis]